MNYQTFSSENPKSGCNTAVLKILISLLLLLSFSANGQELKQTVKCHIMDNDSKAPLFGASLILLDTGALIGASSNPEGYASITVPIGRRSFKISYIGYEDCYLREVLVTTGKELELTVGMQEKLNVMKKVVVSGNTDKSQSINQMAVVSTRQLSIEEGQRYAGGFYDPARMVSSFSGVAATEGDGTNQIVIRGNSPRGLLWRLEGVEIPNPNHFPDGEGDAGGAFCILNSVVLNNFDFYTSAFPAEFGNAYSGIMDIELRKGNASRREYSVLFGLVGTQVAAEGPIFRNKQASYLVTYRYSNFGLLNRAGMLGLAENHLPPLFQDLNFILHFPSKRHGHLTLFGTAGNSWTGWEAYQDSSKWQSWDDRKDDTEIHRVGITGIKYILPFRNNKTWLKTVLAATHQSDNLKTSFLMDDFSPLTAYKSDYATNSIRSNTIVQHKFNARHSLRGGVIYNQLFSNMYQSKYNWTDSLLVVALDKSHSTSLVQAFLQWKFRMTKSLELITGMHALYFDLNQDYSLEPRVALKWQIRNNQSLSFGSGLHSRIEAVPAYFANVLNSQGQWGEFNRNLQLTKSLHSVLGYDVSFKQDFRCKTEVYYQHIFNVPVVDTLNSTMSALNFSYGIPEVQLTNKGTGRNFGVEFTLEKFYAHQWYFLFTASIFDSKYLANNGVWYNTSFNNRFITNFLVGKDFAVGSKKQNIVGLNIKTLIRGGFRYTPIDFEKSVLAGDEVYDWENTFEKQFPLYHRFDLGASYQQNKQGYSWSISLNIYNILNYQNILTYELRHNEKDNTWKIAGVKGLGIVPNLNFKIDF